MTLYSNLGSGFDYNSSDTLAGRTGRDLGMGVWYDEIGANEISLSVERRIRFLGTLNTRMKEAMGIVYEFTRQWHESAGEGSWKPLSESTIETKTIKGYAEPSRILFATGNLFASMTSPTGPYSYMMTMKDGIVFGTNWAPAEFLHHGVRGKSILGRSNIPARPLWPPLHTVTGRTMQDQIRRLFLIDGTAELVNFL